ncbi:MAG TPA: DUF1440 domain-containing protein [Chthoniobacterales bacterium]
MNKTAEQSALGSIIGLIAGVVATGPMTAAMILWHRRLPASQRYPLPPREITMKLARATGVAKHMDHEARSAATLIAHFGYGGAAGAIYGATANAIPAPAWCKGIAAGLVVWGASYLGLLPGTGIIAPATRHPGRRNLLMIGAHLVWGTAMAGLTSLLEDEIHAPGLKPLAGAPLPHRDL